MKGLVLSGGGASGCFEAGILYRLYDEIKFDKIIGTSVGGLNATLMGQAYVDGSPEIIKKVWLDDIDNNDSIFDMNYTNLMRLKPPVSFKPLSNLVKNSANIKDIKKLETEIIVTSVNLISGRVVYISTHDTHVKEDDFKKAIVSSASIPFFTAPVRLFGKVLVDGGIRENIPIKRMIRDKNIDDILVIVATPIAPAKVTPTTMYTNPFKVLERTLDIMANEISITDFKILELVNDLYEHLDEEDAAKIKYLQGKRKINTDIIMPKKKVIDGLLEFNKKALKDGFEKGVEHAEKFLKGKNHKSHPAISYYTYD